MSFKDAKRVKLIKAVLENKLKDIVNSVDVKINRLKEEKVTVDQEVVDPKKKAVKKWHTT